MVPNSLANYSLALAGVGAALIGLLLVAVAMMSVHLTRCLAIATRCGKWGFHRFRQHVLRLHSSSHTRNQRGLSYTSPWSKRSCQQRLAKFPSSTRPLAHAAVQPRWGWRGHFGTQLLLLMLYAGKCALAVVFLLRPD
jgi:hypothetical protein